MQAPLGILPSVVRQHVGNKLGVTQIARILICKSAMEHGIIVCLMLLMNYSATAASRLGNVNTLLQRLFGIGYKAVDGLVESRDMSPRRLHHYS